MNKTKLIQLIENPSQITENDLEHLEEIIATYPYCQVAHMLIAKYTHDCESMVAQQKIRRAAAYALDRGILRQLIVGKTGKNIKNNHIQLKTQVDQLDQQSEKLSEKIQNDTRETTFTKEPSSNQSFFDTISSDNLSDTFAPQESDEAFTSFPDFQEEKQESTPIADNLLNEGMALTLYHEGKEEEAIRVYQQLAKLHPERKQYFYNQISILRGTDFFSEEQDSFKPTTSQNKENQTASFFENLEISEPESNGVYPKTIQEEPNVYEEINEGKAMGLYYDGKIDEAIAMYHKLIEVYPEKKTHYQQQLNDLVGDKSQKDEPVSPSFAIPDDHQSFFEGIQTEEEDKNTSIELPSSTEEKQEDKNTGGSFFDTLEINNQDALPQNFPTPDTLEDDTPVSIPDVTSLQPSKLDNEEETDYINESAAIMLFNQGKNAEAIKIYESLISKNPQKASYYRSQINVLRETEINQASENNNTLPEKTSENLGTDAGSFIPIDLDAYTEEISERAAIQLFNLGSTDEAVAVYEKLILKFPEKKSYFLSQIEILKS